MASWEFVFYANAEGEGGTWEIQVGQPTFLGGPAPPWLRPCPVHSFECGDSDNILYTHLTDDSDVSTFLLRVSQKSLKTYKLNRNCSAFKATHRLSVFSNKLVITWSPNKARDPATAISLGPNQVAVTLPAKLKVRTWAEASIACPTSTHPKERFTANNLIQAPMQIPAPAASMVTRLPCKKNKKIVN